jgi:hypothetical protein
MNYIADTLGIEVIAEPWDGAKHLPFYLADAYNFQLVTLGNVRCLFVRPESELAAISAIKKHFSKISENTDVPLVLDLVSLNARQRKALIAAQIPFVVDGNQLYLPFIGVVLQERYVNHREQRETLFPSAQLVLFHYLYQSEQEMYTSGLAKRLGISAMQISRAVKQLTVLNLVMTRKYGVQIVIAGTESSHNNSAASVIS